MRWAFSWRWYVCSAFNRDRNRPVPGPPRQRYFHRCVYRWTGQRGLARARLAEQPFLPTKKREREEGVPLSNDRVARFPPRSRSFDCLECQARGLACNYCCCCCFQTYARKRLCSFFVCCRGHPPRRSRTLARVATRTRVAPEAGAHLDPLAHRRQLVWTPRILVSDSFFSFYLEW